MNNSTRVGDYVMEVETGRMGVVENVTGDREVVEVRMRNNEELVEVVCEEYENWD